MEHGNRVQDFLQSVKGKSKEELCDLIKLYQTDNDLVEEIINVIEQDHASQTCDFICETLFDFNSCEEATTTFFVQFIPALISAYYSLLSKTMKWSSSKVETLLLYVYNQMAQSNKESPFCNSFSIPTLSKPSIYHELVLGGTSSTLTEHTLSQHDKADRPVLIKGPTKLLGKISAGFRSLVIKSVLQHYNECLSFCLLSSLQSFSRMVMRLSSSGYPCVDRGNDFISTETLRVLQDQPKVNLNGDVMKEMVTALHFIAYNGCADSAVTALKCLRKKAYNSICAAAVLTTDAVQDIINLSCADKCSFEHTLPIDPYKFNYRTAKTSSIQKRRFIKQSHSTPRITRGQDGSSVRPSDTTSPKTPNTVVAAGYNSVFTSPDGPIVEKQNTTESPKCFTPALFELGKKIALMDENLFMNNTIETNVSEDVAPCEVIDEGIRTEDLVDSSDVQLTVSELEPPKIVINLSDLSDGGNSDEVPLITNRTESDMSNEENEAGNSSTSPLHFERIQTNGNVIQYDTQL